MYEKGTKSRRVNATICKESEKLLYLVAQPAHFSIVAFNRVPVKCLILTIFLKQVGCLKPYPPQIHQKPPRISRELGL